jgi:hypothetical protein
MLYLLIVPLQPLSPGADHVNEGVLSVVFVPETGLNEDGAAGPALSVVMSTVRSGDVASLSATNP